MSNEASSVKMKIDIGHPWDSDPLFERIEVDVEHANEMTAVSDSLLAAGWALWIMDDSRLSCVMYRRRGG